MQINFKHYLLLVLVLVSHIKIQAQILTNDEYTVINDLFISESSMFKFPLYYEIQADSLFNLVSEADPKTTNLTASGINEEEYRCILKSFNFQGKGPEFFDSIPIQLEKKRLIRGRKVTKRKKIGMLITRPIISDDHAIIYLKTPGDNYQEVYVIAKSIEGSWQFYGQIMIKTVLLDYLVK